MLLNVGIYCCELPTKNCLYCIPYILVCCISIFICPKKTFSLSVPSFIICLLRRMLFNFHAFVNFPLLLNSSFRLLWSKNILGIILILIFLRLFCGLTYSLSYKMYYVCIRRMYIQLLDRKLSVAVRSIWSYCC